MATDDPAMVTGSATLRLDDEETRITVTVPAGDVTLTDVLPIFHHLTDTLVERGVARAIAAGKRVSCRAGCGACCRQGVPVAPSEARALAGLVDALPEPRRGTIRARFAAGRAAIAAAGLDTGTEARRQRTFEERVKWANDYQRVGVACPFLKDEACSIYPDRPAICREFVVTSPAVYCREPSAETVRRVPLAGTVSRALYAVDCDIEGHGRLMMIDALDWVAAYPAPPGRPGPLIVQAVFAALSAMS